MNDIDDRLCLRQIHSPIQKCTLCKFTGLGRSRSIFDHSFQNAFHHINTAMTIDLHRIFTCKAMWSPHDHHKHFINCLFTIYNISIMYCVTFFFLKIFFFFSFINLLDNFKCFITTHSDNSDS